MNDTCKYHADMYDRNGMLRAPAGTWLVLFLLSHGWWLVALDSATGGQCAGFISALYPSQPELIYGLVTGFPVWLFAFVYPLRMNWKQAMKVTYVLLILAAVTGECRSIWYAVNNRHLLSLELWGSLVLLYLGCLIQLYPDRHNRDAFVIP